MEGASTTSSWQRLSCLRHPSIRSFPSQYSVLTSLHFIRFYLTFISLPLFVLPGHPVPTSFLHHSLPPAPTPSSIFGFFFAAKSQHYFPSPKDDLKALLEALTVFWWLECFTTLKLFPSFTHVSHLSILPVSFHTCSSSPFYIIHKYIPYSRSLMKMLINTRAHAAATHQKPLCNSTSFCSFCCCFWSISQGPGNTVQLALLQKPERQDGAMRRVQECLLLSDKACPSLPSSCRLSVCQLENGSNLSGGVGQDVVAGVWHAAGAPSHVGGVAVSFSDKISISIPQVDMSLKFTKHTKLSRR